MDKRMSAVLICLAFALSSVTAVSVAMTIFSLIDDPILAIIFAGAAVLLDIFKYLGWPLAVRLLDQQRFFFTSAICSCVITLGAVSGWSTYDRLMGSITASQSKQAALAGGRIDHLTALIKKDSDFIETLGKTEKKSRSESSDLRIKGMVTKAQELESALLERVDTQRQAAMERINSSSLEIAQIQSSNVKVASIPTILAILLCAGFALSLELVPALLLSVLHSPKPEIDQFEEIVDPSTLADHQSHSTSVSTGLVPNNSLLDALLLQASSLPSQSNIKVKDFASANRIGNLKACLVFKEAEALGAIRKTRRGYLTALQASEQIKAFHSALENKPLFCHSYRVS